ncbi:MAG: glycosyltransferase [Chloroflexi bacterium]|nr:glycosyltransferase [Chloroflexota bacterium]
MIVVVLPAYNEQDTIVPLIESIRKTARKRFIEKMKIVVVDDGSSDDTAVQVDAQADEDTILVRHPQNKGLGEAIKTGFLYALNLHPDVDIIVTMDSDNTHTPGLLARMIMTLDEGNDMVIASRYRPGARVVGLSWYREILSIGMSWMFRILLPIPGVRDYSCGYRAYRAALLREAFKRWGDQFVSQSGFSCMVDILLKLHRLGAIVTEVPLILHYDYKRGKSKMNVSKTIRETLRLAFRERSERWGKSHVR